MISQSKDNTLCFPKFCDVPVNSKNIKLVCEYRSLFSYPLRFAFCVRKEHKTRAKRSMKAKEIPQMKLMIPLHNHQKTSMAKKSSSPTTSSSPLMSIQYEKAGVRPRVIRKKRSSASHGRTRLTTLPASFELLLKAGEIIASYHPDLQKQQDANSVRPLRTVSFSSSAEEHQDGIRSRNSTPLEADPADRDWKRVCRPVPAPPRLPSVPAGFAFGADVRLKR